MVSGIKQLLQALSMHVVQIDYQITLCVIMMIIIIVHVASYLVVPTYRLKILHTYGNLAAEDFSLSC